MVGEDEVAVAHATWQDDLTVFDRHLLENRGVADIVIIPRRQGWFNEVLWIDRIRREIPHASGNIAAVVVKHIGVEAALAQEVLAAGEVVHPAAALVPPGERAVEVQAELPEAHARHAVVGLVRVAVKDNLVEPIAKLLVGIGLQAERVLRPAVILAERGECFARDDRLAVGVRGARRFLRVVLAALGVRRVAGVEFAAEPEFALRDIHHAEALELVDGNRHANAGSLCFEDGAVFVQDFAEGPVEIFVDEIGNGAAVIPEESVCLIDIVHDAAGEGGQPFDDVIATACFELGGEFRPPSLATGLPAIDVHIIENRPEQRAEAVADPAEHSVVEMVLQRLRAEFVDLQTGGTLGDGFDFVAVRGVAEAEDGPASLGQRGLEHSPGNKIAGEVDDFFRIDALGVRHGELGGIGCRGEGTHARGFDMDAGDACGLEIQVVQGEAARNFLELDPHEAGFLLGESIDQLHIARIHRRLPAAGLDELAPGFSIVADRKDGVDVFLFFKEVEIQRADGDGLGKLHGEFVVAGLRERRERHRGVEFPIQRGGPIDPRHGRCDLWLEIHHRPVVAFERGKSQHGDIAVVMVVGARLGEGDGLEFAALDMRGGPDDFLHGEFRRDPRPARARAARGARHAELKAEALALLGGVFHQVEPERGEHAGVAVGSIGQTALADVDDLGPLEADGFHGLEVFGDSLFGDFVIQPMPPGARARGIGRIQKLAAQVIARGEERRGGDEESAEEWKQQRG